MTTKTLSDYGISLRATKPGDYKTTCPECSHLRTNKRDACLSVTVGDDGGCVWHCHHCGWVGGFKNKAASGKAHGFKAERFNQVRKEPIKLPEQTQLPEKAVKFFSDRWITNETVVRHGIRCDGNGIQFPYFRRGECVNIKTRLPGKQFRQVAGAEKIYYGLDDIAGHDVVIVVEGEMDKLAFFEAGHSNCVSVPDGAPKEVKATLEEGEKKFEYVSNCWDEFEGKTIILATDSDAPGKALAEELSRRYGKDRCKLVTWPEGCKDANEVLMKLGVYGLQEALDEAKFYPIDGAYTVDDFFQSSDDWLDDADLPTVSTGWAALDHLYKIPSDTGYLHIVTGAPNSGKSEFLDNLLVNLAENEGWGFAMWSPENGSKRHSIRLGSKFLGRRINRQNVTPAEIEGRVHPFMKKHFHFIRYDNVDDPSIDKLLDTARALVGRYGLRGIVLDPYNNISKARPSHVTETEFVSQVLGKLRRFCVNYGVHVWFVAHPTKLETLSSGEAPPPSLYQISGGANWINKADFGIVVHRTKDKNGRDVTDVYVRKVRFQPDHGKPGVERFTFDSRAGRFNFDTGWR